MGVGEDLFVTRGSRVGAGVCSLMFRELVSPFPPLTNECIRFTLLQLDFASKIRAVGGVPYSDSYRGSELTKWLINFHRTSTGHEYLFQAKDEVNQPFPPSILIFLCSFLHSSLPSRLFGGFCYNPRRKNFLRFLFCIVCNWRVTKHGIRTGGVDGYVPRTLTNPYIALCIGRHATVDQTHLQGERKETRRERETAQLDESQEKALSASCRVASDSQRFPECMASRVLCSRPAKLGVALIACSREHGLD